MSNYGRNYLTQTYGSSTSTTSSSSTSSTSTSLIQYPIYNLTNLNYTLNQIEFYNVSTSSTSSTSSTTSTSESLVSAESSDFTLASTSITINKQDILGWLPPYTSPNDGENYSRCTYEVSFIPIQRGFNTALSTINTLYFNDNTFPEYIINKLQREQNSYNTTFNNLIGITQSTNDKLLSLDVSSIQQGINPTAISDINLSLVSSILPVALTDFAAIVVPFYLDNVITYSVLYILGGKNSAGDAVNTIYYTQLDSNNNPTTWVTSSTTLPTTIYNCGIVFDGNDIILIGGNVGNGTYSSDIMYMSMNNNEYYAQYLNPDINSVTTNPASFPVAAENLCVIYNEFGGSNYYFVFGGNNASKLNTIYVGFRSYDYSIYSYEYTFSLLSTALPISGNMSSCIDSNYNLYIIGDNGTNTYILSSNNAISNYPSLTSGSSFDFNTYELPFLGSTDKNALFSSLDNILVFINSNNSSTTGENYTLYFSDSSNFVSSTLITSTTSSSISSTSLVLPITLDNVNFYNSNGEIIALGGLNGTTVETSIYTGNLSNSSDTLYYISLLINGVNPLTEVPQYFYYIDPITIYNVIADNIVPLTPTNVYNKTIEQDGTNYNFGYTVMNADQTSYYDEVIGYDYTTGIFTLKLTVTGVINYSSSFIFESSRFPLFFISNFIFNNIIFDPRSLTSSNLPNTIYSLIDGLMEGTQLLSINAYLKGNFNTLVLS